MPEAPPSLFDHAVAARAHEGAGVSGDLHMVRPLDHGVVVAVVDGLGDLLVFATDRIREGFAEGLRPESPLQEIADRVLASHGRPNDDALVLAGRWNGPTEARSL
jgi:hypothetical protein